MKIIILDRGEFQVSTVSVVSCPDYRPETVRKALSNVLAPLGGVDFVRPGMKIIIKANLVSMMKPDSAATTHPELLYALCHMLTEKGAEVIVGDSPGGLYTSAYVNAVYNATGVKKILETGAKLNQDFSHRHAQNPDGHTLMELEYTSYLDSADVIINFCKLKTHGMMGMSACVKNMFGVIPGIFKPEYHYLYSEHPVFADMLVDLNVRFPQRLAIVDAVVGMEGNGPTAGTPRQIGALIASDSPYDCDRVCAKLIGIDEDELETISASKKRGLTSDYTLSGDIDRLIVSDYRLVRTRKDTAFYQNSSSLFSRFLGYFIKKALMSIPKVRKRQCVGCKKCMEICPAKAIRMKNKKPVIDRNACIRCFCCQEFCPVGAMKVKRPMIAKLFNR